MNCKFCGLSKHPDIIVCSDKDLCLTMRLTPITNVISVPIKWKTALLGGSNGKVFQEVSNQAR